MATAAKCLASAPIDAGQRLFAEYERIVPDARDRMNQFIEEMHRGFPQQCPQFEDVIRQYAIAKWRSELFYAMEASFINAALADEVADNESKPPAERPRESTVFGRAMRRDAEGPNVFSKLLRFESRVFKELERAKTAFLAVIQAITNLQSNPKQMAKPRAEAQQTAAPETPRNAPCPCGSGVKFKRCCGVASPPVLCAA